MVFTGELERVHVERFDTIKGHKCNRLKFEK